MRTVAGLARAVAAADAAPRTARARSAIAGGAAAWPFGASWPPGWPDRLDPQAAWPWL